MKLRLNYRTSSPHVLQAMMNLQKSDSSSSIDKVLHELIKIRVSQINGCAFCLDMHAKDLLKLGDYQDHILLLNAWREAPIYTEPERAALTLAEAVTRISENGVPEDVYDQAREAFDEKTFMELILAINTINSWNRIAISTGMFPGCFD
ncbi:carboxymuconolactone decarboxylase family protein [Paenibacillus sp. HJL G12]|uniref:Carboxymuconolactone decarboxylase family protein n=1 Tax=Paenibacillus dendrobii TaxID=2691084 RepID=A0A7X3LIV4_9BACL|nr:carboxymuconolactone decarboxylase family protein [Paenibacillus dendrobii]MWV46537.1 carboxymuconolactone decarboxylase family protein [Paenibacillus dendrobii]